MKEVGDALPDQSVKKGRAAKGAVRTVAKKMTPVEDRRAKKERHRAVKSELAGYGMTAPESSIEAALYENDNDVLDAYLWLLDPTRTEELSVRRI